MRVVILGGLFLCFFYTLVGQQSDSLKIDSFFNLGKQSFLERDYAGAVSFWQEELALKEAFYGGNHPEVVRTASNIGNSLNRQNMLNQAKRYYEKVLNIQLGWLPKNPADDKIRSGIILTYKQLILLERKLGDYDKAILLYENCKNNLKVSAADIPKMLVYKAQALEEKGGVFIDEAIETYLEAIAIYKAKNSQKLVGITWNDLGNAYNLKKDFPAAHEAYLAAYRLLQKDGSAVSKNAFNVTNNLGASFIKIKDYKSAEIYLNDAIKLLEKLYPDDPMHYKFSSPYHNLGDLYGEQKSYEKALFYYDKSLEHLVPGLEKIMTEFPVEEIGDEIFKGPKTVALIALASKAKCLADSGEKQAALDTYNLVDKLVFKLREDLSTESSNLHWVEGTRAMYEAAANLAVDLKQTERAFEFIEKSKSVLLFENLRRAEQIQLENLSFAQQGERAELQEKVLQTERKIAAIQQDNSGQLSALKNERLGLKNMLADFDEKHFGVNSLDFDYRKNTLVDFKKYLGKTACTAIEFFGDMDNLLVAVIDEKQIRFHQYDKYPDRSANLQNWIEAISRLPVSNQEIKKTNELASAIYQDLMQPLELPPHKKLLIIPDGILQFVPFEALRFSPEIETEVKTELPYLLFRNPVAYAYSASVQLQLLHKKNNVSGKSLVIAPKTFPDLPTLDSDEANIVSKLLGAHLLEDKAATTTAFLDEVAHHDLIHLSTHADASTAAQPWIAFKDRKLNLSELYNLNLNARLVTLSACETAKGELVRGEGVLSLARGFSFAGVPQVITSLWKVNEQSTTKIMALFYQFLQKGIPVSEALANAKKEYLATHSLSDAAPYHWAAFTALGHDSYAPEKGWFRWWYVALLFAASLVFLFLKKVIMR